MIESSTMHFLYESIDEPETYSFFTRTLSVLGKLEAFRKFRELF